MQDLYGVYVFNVPEREELDRPTARLIKDFDCIEGQLSPLQFSGSTTNYFDLLPMINVSPTSKLCYSFLIILLVEIYHIYTRWPKTCLFPNPNVLN